MQQQNNATLNVGFENDTVIQQDLQTHWNILPAEVQDCTKLDVDCTIKEDYLEDDQIIAVVTQSR